MNMDTEKAGEVLGLCPRSFDCPFPNVNLALGPSPSYVSLASSILACAGSLLIMGIYVIFKDLRKSVAQSIITQLALADFANSLGVIVAAINFLWYFNSKYRDGSKACQTFETVCILQSYITQWAGVTSYIWTSLLAIFLMLRYSCTNRAMLLFSKLMPLLTVISWIFPLLFLLPMLSQHKLGYSPYGASNWCYIRDTDYGNSLEHKRIVVVLMIFADWIWQILSILVVIVSFAAMYIHLCYQRNRYSLELLDAEVRHDVTVVNVEKRLLLIPIAYIIIHIWDSCQIIASLILSDKVDHHGCTQPNTHGVFLVFGILQGIGDSAQGWVNALLYVFASSKLRKRLFWEPLSHVTCLRKNYTSSSILKVQHPDTNRLKVSTSLFETASPTLVPTGIGAASDN